MKLTEYFELREFTCSSTASRLHIDNTVNPSDPTGQSIINNLKNLTIDYEFLADTAETMVQLAFTQIMLNKFFQ